MNGPAPPEPVAFDALVPAATARKAEDIGVAKVSMGSERLFVLGLLAGAFISFGAIFSTVVTAGGGMAPGVARLLGGLVFSTGLILVVVGGAELFTGNTLMVMAAASRRVRVGRLARCWGIVYVGNAIGAIAMAALFFMSGRPEAGDGSIGVRALQVAEAKTALPIGEAFVSGILANALVCLAVWMSMSARSVSDKVLAVIFPISAFVAAGLEHSIANLYFVPAGLFTRAWAADSFWTTTGLDESSFPDMTWSRFLVHNLVPVTLGNIVGGAVLVGMTYWFVYLRHRGPE